MVSKCTCQHSELQWHWKVCLLKKKVRKLKYVHVLYFRISGGSGLLHQWNTPPEGVASKYTFIKYTTRGGSKSVHFHLHADQSQEVQYKWNHLAACHYCILRTAFEMIIPHTMFRVTVKGETASYIRRLDEGGDGKSKIEVDSDSKTKVSTNRHQ